MSEKIYILVSESLPIHSQFTTLWTSVEWNGDLVNVGLKKFQNEAKNDFLTLKIGLLANSFNLNSKGLKYQSTVMALDNESPLYVI